MSRWLVDHAAHDVGEIVLVGLGQGLALDVGVEAMVGELGDDGLDALAGQFHLVQGLDGGQTRDGAGAPLAAGSVAARRAPFRLRPVGRGRPGCCWVRSCAEAYAQSLLQGNQVQAGAGRAAALVALATARPGPGLVLVLDGQDAVADDQALEAQVP